jgi:hypothetical protein
MKVTAIIPDSLVNEVKRYSGGSTITESLLVALQEWLSLKKIEELNGQVDARPLKFRKGFSAAKARALNRK